jgi:hypothetical protein
MLGGPARKLAICLTDAQQRYTIGEFPRLTSAVTLVWG